jgi:tetratricopeptide (TPR) repeat protein
MEINDYLNNQEWDSVIAACTVEIEAFLKNSPAIPANPACHCIISPPCTHSPETCVIYAYMCRGFARCFVSSKDAEKDDGYKKAINDFSTALHYIDIADPKCAYTNKSECYAKHAYAYWLDNNYAEALNDCGRFFSSSSKSSAFPDYKASVLELKGNIYAALGHPVETVTELRKALRVGRNAQCNFGLLEKYRGACNNLNGV